MKNFIFGLFALFSFSAFAENLRCYHSDFKPVCGYLVENEQMRSCRVDVSGRDNDDRRTVLSLYAEESYEPTENKVSKFFRIKKAERKIAIKLKDQVEEIKATLPACEY